MRTPDLSSQGNLQVEIDKLKDSNAYRNEYATIEQQELMQAVDIIVALRREAVASGNKMIWNKLLHATEHLEKLLRKHQNAGPDTGAH